MRKRSLLAILLSVIAITGCQNTQSIDKQPSNYINGNANETNLNTDMSIQTDIQGESHIQVNDLADYEWQLISATDSEGQPAHLLNSIRKDVGFEVSLNSAAHRGNAIYFSVGCNGMQSDFVLKDNTLSVGNIMATEMYCEDLDAAERLMSNAMSGYSQLSLTDNATPQVQPILTQITHDNMTLIWQGRQTPERKYNQVGDTVFWEIDNVQPLCPNGQPNTCLKVRPVYYDEYGMQQGVGDWDIFVGNIKGYTHDNGQKQVVRLKRFVTDPVDVKGKQFVYVLDMIVKSSVVQ